jgi:hypothetical protein
MDAAESACFLGHWMSVRRTSIVMSEPDPRGL